MSWVVATFEHDAVLYLNENTISLGDMSYTMCPKELRENTEPTAPLFFTTKAETKAYTRILNAKEREQWHRKPRRWEAFKMVAEFPKNYYSRKA